MSYIKHRDRIHWDCGMRKITLNVVSFFCTYILLVTINNNSCKLYNGNFMNNYEDCFKYLQMAY